jgi:uncharacterized OB-fold protein
VSEVPLADGLFTWPSDEPQLIGARCEQCAVVTFPFQGGCPRCGSERMAQTLLPNRGTLFTWTTQEFPPKSPPYAGPDTAATFEPFAVGYVELPGCVKVEARLTESDPTKLAFGMEMELTIVPFTTDDDGNDVMVFAFRPAASATR